MAARKRALKSARSSSSDPVASAVGHVVRAVERLLAAQAGGEQGNLECAEELREARRFLDAPKQRTSVRRSR